MPLALPVFGCLKREGWTLLPIPMGNLSRTSALAEPVAYKSLRLAALSRPVGAWGMKGARGDGWISAGRGLDIGKAGRGLYNAFSVGGDFWGVRTRGGAALTPGCDM